MQKEIHRILSLLSKTKEDVIDDESAQKEGFIDLDDYKVLALLREHIDLLIEKCVYPEKIYLSDSRGKNYTKKAREQDITKDLVKIYLLKKNNGN